LIEAALRGKPIVSTTLGAEGLGFTDRQEARLCDTPHDFAQACVTLMADPAAASAQGAAARSFAQQHYDRDRIAESLAAQCRQRLTGG
jgi:glycosyltransferase involved in cell wall biosynthesis